MAKAERARQMLEWCRAGHARMMQPPLPMGGDWMILWAGTISLLRGSLHALQKVDSKRDPKIKVEQAKWWDRLKGAKPLIFHSFIDNERNMLLKMGEITAGPSFTANVYPGRIVFGPDNRMRPVPPNPAVPTMPNEFGYAILGGHYQSHDPRNLVAEAITWIEQQLDEIERNATDVRGPVNSPLEAGSIRHPRPVETATPGRRHRAVKRGKLPLTNNFIW
jgi:hypothetical protein